MIAFSTNPPIAVCNFQAPWNFSKTLQTGNRASDETLPWTSLWGLPNGVDDTFVNTKLNEFNAYWEKEYNKYKHYIVENQEDFKKNVECVNQNIVQIKFDDYEIELTPNNAVKYTLLLPDKKMLMITKSFNAYEDKMEKYVVVSIFENKKLILSDIKNLDELVTGINKYIDMERFETNGTT